MYRKILICLAKWGLCLKCQTRSGATRIHSCWAWDRLKASIHMDFEVDRMEPLFASKEDYAVFNQRQSQYNIKTAELSQYKGNCYLGIDAGSTYHNKVILVGEDGALFYTPLYSNKQWKSSGNFHPGYSGNL